MQAVREKEIFGQALDAPPEERIAMLDRACNGDVHLRSRVLRLLELHDAAGEFMAEPACLSRDGTIAVQATPEDLTGTTLGRYLLKARIGEGGFGMVYLAEQEHPVRRRVALKVLKAGMDSQRIIARFQSERRTLAMMEHPGIARILDAGETPEGRPYFVMEYVDGEPITDYCIRKRLSLEERLELFERVCLAVQHAHTKGVIHRDIKPSNVLVSEVDQRAEPKVIDFGIAKAIDPERDGHTALTEAKQIVGTPEYMAPEQASSDADAIDTRTDVYALGILLYELLCGLPPFDRARLRRASPAELERIIGHEEAPRPSTRLRGSTEHEHEAKRLSRRLRGDVDWIVMRAMEKDPGRRYATTYALATDVRRYLEHEPVDAGPPSRGYRLRKLVRRHRPQFIGAAIAVVALLALVGFSLKFAADASAARGVAIDEGKLANIALEAAQTREQEAAKELAKYRSIANLVREMFKSIDPAVARGADTSVLEQMLTDSRDRMTATNPEPEVEAEVLTILGFAASSIGDDQNAEPMLKRAAELSEELHGPRHPQTLEALSGYAKALVNLSRFDEAHAAFTEVLARAEANSPDLWDQDTLRQAGNVAVATLEGGNHDEAASLLEGILERSRTLLGDQHETTLTTINNLATAYSRLEREREALTLYEEVLAGQIAAHGEDHPKTLTTLNNLALSHDKLGNTEECERILRDVLAIKRRVYPPGHPSTALSMNNLAGVLAPKGRMEEAEALWDEALELFVAAVGETDLRVLMLKTNVAGAHHENGDPARAVEILRDVFATAQEVYPDHPHARAIAHRLGGAALDAGDYAPGLQAERWAIAQAGPDDKRTPVYRATLARLLIGTEQLDEAEAEILAIEPGVLEVTDPNDQRVRTHALARAELAEAHGDNEAAAQWRAKLETEH